MNVPCGRCIGCRIDRSREWATRIMHEASLYAHNCFITLTYDEKHIPSHGSLVKSDFQKFMKRYRKFLEEHTWSQKKRCYEKNPNITVFDGRSKSYVKKVCKCYVRNRFYHCGEYGDRNNRPHYHAVIFGHNFFDWVYLFDSPSGMPVYTSPTLEKIWQKGYVTIGELTFESAAYVARYVLKKVNGDLSEVIDDETGLKHYERIDLQTGQVVEVIPEYSTQSRRPGIGRNWIDVYRTDVYPKDFTTIRGVKVKPPRYYDKMLRSIDPVMYDEIKVGRNLNAYLSTENTEPRLVVREKVKAAQLKNLKRSI